MHRQFQKCCENFVCEHCDTHVKGNGYTNHCPRCLWSKHVDVMPGDRAASCEGLMKPAAIEQKGPKFILVHVCESCGHQKRNRLSKEDDFSVVLSLSKAYVSKAMTGF